MIVSVISILLTILDSKRILKDGMLYAFIILTFIACIRYDYGNDYISYMNDFDRIGRYSLSYIFSEQESLQYSDPLFKDIGAVTLFRILHPLGFYFFIALVSLFQGYVFYQFIKENVSRDDYWIALFIYLFNFNFYVLPMSMIRQGLVISLFVWSWHFIRQGKLLIPILITLIGITIHKSSVILLPFVFIKYIPFSKGKIISFFLLSLMVLFMIGSGLLNSIYSEISNLEAFTIYAGYEEEGGSKMGIIRKIITYTPFSVALFYIGNNKFSTTNRALAALSCIGILILPFTTIVHLISRLCYYFDIFTVVAIPISFHVITNRLVRYLMLGLIMATLFYQYCDLFFNSVYTERFMEFHTIWSDLKFLYEA